MTARPLTIESDQRRQPRRENFIHSVDEVPISRLVRRKLIRAGYGWLIPGIAAAVFAGEVLASETVRRDDVAPATNSDSGLASAVGDNPPSASSNSVANQSARAEANEFEGIRSAAEQGVAQAQYSLGLCYESGRGVAKDPAQAIRWFRQAAEQGYDEAEYTLGCCYNGDDGFPKDPSVAVKWWEKAAAQGYADAQYCLGLSYSIGEGVSKNPAEAVKWWSKAAEQDQADAEYFLGLCYSTGLGVPKVPKQAVYWLSKAAAHGNEYAMAALKKFGPIRADPAKT
jgi:TPR repeat protein